MLKCEIMRNSKIGKVDKWEWKMMSYREKMT